MLMVCMVLMYVPNYTYTYNINTYTRTCTYKSSTDKGTAHYGGKEGLQWKRFGTNSYQEMHGFYEDHFEEVCAVRSYK